MSGRGVVKRALGYGTRRGQPFFERLHRFALHGMNVGTPAFPHSGELALLRAVAAEVGEGPATVVDAGAHTGVYALAAADALPGAQVHAFEPAAATFARLEERVAGHRRIHAHRAALGEQPGELELHFDPAAPDEASLHPARSRGHVERVPVRTLTEFCAEHDIERVDLLKLDVEGHELHVLRGAGTLLERGGVAWIQFEFGTRNVASRTFLSDFFDLLGPRYELARVLQDGLRPLPGYDPWLELHVGEPANYAARLVA